MAQIDPDIFEWMGGFPPAPERRISFSDGTYSRYPQTKWSYSHLVQLVPTKPAWRGPSAASALPSGASFVGQAFSWTPSIAQTGVHSVTFRVDDTEPDTDSETIDITVERDGERVILPAVLGKGK